MSPDLDTDAEVEHESGSPFDPDELTAEEFAIAYKVLRSLRYSDTFDGAWNATLDDATYVLRHQALTWTDTDPSKTHEDES